MGQNPGFKRYFSKGRVVKARRMREDFHYETSVGFSQGKKGDWLVEVAPKIRFACGDKEFRSAYKEEKADAED